jgi:hypothetical protein
MLLLSKVDPLKGLLKETIGLRCSKVLYISCQSYCHWMDAVDCYDIAKVLIRMWGNLSWKFWMACLKEILKVLLQDW